MGHEGIDVMEVAVKRVLENDHVENELLSSLAAYQTAKIFKKILKKLVHGFKESAKAAKRSHMIAIKLRDTTAEHIMNYRLFLRCADFYKEDIKRVNYMLKEFKTYLVSGHFFEMFSGGERKQEDMFDFTKV
jgi:hypothetical protein